MLRKPSKSFRTERSEPSPENFTSVSYVQAFSDQTGGIYASDAESQFAVLLSSIELKREQLIQ